MQISPSFSLAAFVLKKGALVLPDAGIDIAPRGMVFPHASEWASGNGDFCHAISKADWKQEKRELIRKPNIDLRGAIL